MSVLSLFDVDFVGKIALVRADLNVPLKQGQIQNTKRLDASLPTLRYLLNEGAGVIIMTHLGRPEEGKADARFSTATLVDYLSDKLGRPVRFCADLAGVNCQTGEVVLLENVRFNAGEKSNDPILAKRYAQLADVFVMDAFGTAHRAQASTQGVIYAMMQIGNLACAGLLLQDELEALEKVMDAPASPVVAIVGGAKASTKMEVLLSLSEVCDAIITGGGIANTFLAAQGINVGASLYEPDFVETAQKIMQKTRIITPNDVVIANKNAVDFEDFLDSLERAHALTKSVECIGADEMILDPGPISCAQYAQIIKDAKTILWNGPVGVFEVAAFAKGTRALAQAIADADGFCVAGGGDTLSAIDHYQIAKQVDYISTGGGAFLEFIKGKSLPAVHALSAASKLALDDL